MAEENDKRLAIEKSRRFYKILLDHGYNINSMYLFGSYVKNKNRKDSDIDIAVILKTSEESLFDEQVKLMRIAGRFEDSVIEVHPFDENDFRIGNPFIDEIKRTGIRVV